jgi:VWFA-related protein
MAIGMLVATLSIPAGELRALGQQQPAKQQPPAKQEKEYAITVEVPLVNVDVVVTDNQGGFITGLKRENFRILEDGMPQTVTNFAPTEAPITIVIVMEFSKLAYEYYAYQSRDWAHWFLSFLGKDDWVALVSYDLRPRIEVDFTKDKIAVQNHIARMYFPGFTEACLFDALLDTLDRLGDVKGKKSILILASGYDTFSKHTLDDTLKRLKQTDVTIFAVGVGREYFEYYDAAGGYSGASRVGYYQAENQLNGFSRATGGRAWFPRFQGELPNIFRDVASHLRNQYSLGYSPANRAQDGKFRKIKVEVLGNDGQPLVILDQKGKKVKYVVYAREGYQAPKGVGD